MLQELSEAEVSEYAQSKAAVIMQLSKNFHVLRWLDTINADLRLT
jgi:hypothetical protein